jgi:hypothetical protein
MHEKAADYPEPFSAAALLRTESRGLGASSIDAPEVRIVHSMKAVYTQ